MENALLIIILVLLLSFFVNNSSKEKISILNSMELNKAIQLAKPGNVIFLADGIWKDAIYQVNQTLVNPYEFSRQEINTPKGISLALHMNVAYIQQHTTGLT